MRAALLFGFDNWGCSCGLTLPFSCLSSEDVEGDEGRASSCSASSFELRAQPDLIRIGRLGSYGTESFMSVS